MWLPNEVCVYSRVSCIVFCSGDFWVPRGEAAGDKRGGMTYSGVRPSTVKGLIERHRDALGRVTS